MFRASKDREKSVKENMRGGEGTIEFNHYFSKEEIPGPCRLCAEIIVPVGASIGLHQHENEDEVFVILSGHGVLNDGKIQQQIDPGDAILTRSGESHAIRNTGSEPLKFVAFIITYS